MRTSIPLLFLSALFALSCTDGEDTAGDTPRPPQGDDTGSTGDDTGSTATGEGWTDLGGGLSQRETTITTNELGRARLKLDLESARSFLVTGVVAQSSSGWIAIENIQDPNGDVVLTWEDWYYGPYSLTYAFIPAQNTTVNWPAREIDGPIADGEWTVVLGAYDPSTYDYLEGVDIDVTAHMNTDSNTDAGTLKAVIVYTEGLDQDNEVVSGVEAGVEHWKWIWGRIGMDIEVRYATSDLDTDLSDPSYGSGQLNQASQLGEDDEMVILLGDTVDGSTWTYGVSGNVPGALNPTKNSGVVVSWLSCAGQDAKFNDGEIEDLGETFAHEVGHYVGLFHPVEDGFRDWDALDDTVECDAWSECEDALGENLMFPYPVCSGGNNCNDQNQLSGDQSGVMQHYTGTR